MTITNRDVISTIISSRYNSEEMQDRKRKLLNLFFSNVLTNQEYQDTIDLINDTSDSMRKDSKFLEGAGNIGDFATRKAMIMNSDHKQLEAYHKFNENIRKHFDFRIGPEESNIHFRMGPQSSYFYIKLDHRIDNGTDVQYRKFFTYNDNKREVRSKYGMGKEIKYKPQVYINPRKVLFRNILNFMKEKDWFDDFGFQFEEKVLIVI